MTFIVGDKVLILTELVPWTLIHVPPGTKATVIAVDDNRGASVEYDDNGRLEQWWFFGNELKLIPHQMLAPLMELGEIEEAEKLMEGLKLEGLK